MKNLIIFWDFGTVNTKEIRKILKVLLRKSKGLNRIERIKEMDKGLIALNLAVVRQKRDKGFSFVSYETLDYIDELLKRALQARV